MSDFSRNLSLLFGILACFFIQSCGNGSGYDPYFADPITDPRSSLGAPVFERCYHNNRTKLWAQIATDSDLAIKQVEDWGIKTSKTRVAVIDSGFDPNRLSSYFQNLSSFKFKDLATPGASASDVIGHGTAVASMISAGRGLGINPRVNLSVYKITSTDKGEVKPEVLDAAIKTACEDGNEIINVSWGGFSDESRQMPEEISQADYYRNLAERGCLVFKSAGNSNYLSSRPEADLDDALLRVGAINIAADFARFSSTGEVYAPGERVFVIDSTQSDPIANWESDRQKCGSEAGRFISGTSFSAPFAAGVASLVLDVLRNKSGDDLAKFSAKQRVSLLARILNASQMGGYINSLRAVTIAYEVDLNSGSLPRVSDLEKLPKTKCKLEKLAKCSEQDGVIDSGCIEKFRFQNGFCSQESLKLNAATYLESIFGRNPDFAVGVFHIAQSLNVFSDIDSSRIASQIWEKSIASNHGYVASYNIDFDVATSLLPAIIVNFPTDSSAQLQAWLEALFTSYDFSQRISNVPHRGGDAAYAKILNIIQATRKRLGEAIIQNTIHTWLGYWNPNNSMWSGEYYQKYYFQEEYVNHLSRVNEMFQTSLPNDFSKDFLNQLDAAILNRLNQRNYTLTVDGDVIGALILGNSNFFYPPYLDGIVSRNLSKIKNLDRGNIWEIFVHERPLYHDLSKENLDYYILESLENGKGWSWTDDIQVLDSLFKRNQHIEAPKLTEMRPRVDRMYDNALSLAALVTGLNLSSDHPLAPTPEQRGRIARRIVGFFLNSKLEVILRNSRDFKIAVAAASKTLLNDSEFRHRFYFSVAGYNAYPVDRYNRFNFTSRLTFKETSNKDLVPEILSRIKNVQARLPESERKRWQLLAELFLASSSDVNARE